MTCKCLLLLFNGFKMDLVPLRNLGYLAYLFKQLLRFQRRFHDSYNSHSSPSANKAATCQQDRSPKELATESYKEDLTLRDRTVGSMSYDGLSVAGHFLLFSFFSPSSNCIHSKTLEISRNGYLTPCSKIMANTSVVVM